MGNRPSLPPPPPPPALVAPIFAAVPPATVSVAKVVELPPAAQGGGRPSKVVLMRQVHIIGTFTVAEDDRGRGRGSSSELHSALAEQRAAGNGETTMYLVVAAEPQLGALPGATSRLPTVSGAVWVSALTLQQWRAELELQCGV